MNTRPGCYYSIIEMKLLNIPNQFQGIKNNNHLALLERGVCIFNTVLFSIPSLAVIL